MDIKLSRTPPCWGALCTTAGCVWTWCTLAKRCISPTTWPTWGTMWKCSSSTAEERTCLCIKESSAREVSGTVWVSVRLNVCVHLDKPLVGILWHASHPPPPSSFPSDSFQFLSMRHRGFPFSLTFFLNGLQVERLSSCCEFKHRKGSRLGGRHGHFGFVSVEGASPCYK